MGDVCAALAKLRWTEEDPERVSDMLARSLDAVIEMEREHGCQ